MRSSNTVKILSILSGPAAFLTILALPAPDDMPPEAWKVVAVFSWMILWWLTEAITLAVTALLPVVLLPFTNVVPINEATELYAHPLIFLFLGGFLLAMAIQSADLHHRIALLTVSRIGAEPRRLMLGFMIATAGLSMWISNTSSAILMAAVAMSLAEFMKSHGMPDKEVRGFTVGLLLSVAYSASIGGVGTLIGSPVNGLFASIMVEEYGLTIDFLSWFMVGFPFVIVMIGCLWLAMGFVLYPPRHDRALGLDSVIDSELAALGPPSRHERTVLAVFAFTATGWLFGDQIGSAVGIPVTDASVAIAAAVLLFAIPVDLSKRKFALDWQAAKDLPWHVLLLIGGGLSMANAVQASGLAAWIGTTAGHIALPEFWLVLLVVAAMVAITEVMSNPASAATLIPVFAAVAVGLEFNPALLALPAAMAANMSFMMPVATAPNAVVFARPEMRITDMLRPGFVINLIAIAVITLGIYFVVRPVFGW